MPSDSRDAVDDVAQSKDAYTEYTQSIAALEEENHLLRQTVQQLRAELERLRTPPLMVAEVTDI